MFDKLKQSLSGSTTDANDQVAAAAPQVSTVAAPLTVTNDELEKAAADLSAQLQENPMPANETGSTTTPPAVAGPSMDQTPAANVAAFPTPPTTASLNQQPAVEATAPDDLSSLAAMQPPMAGSQPVAVSQTPMPTTSTPPTPTPNPMTTSTTVPTAPVTMPSTAPTATSMPSEPMAPTPPTMTPMAPMTSPATSAAEPAVSTPVSSVPTTSPTMTPVPSAAPVEASTAPTNTADAVADTGGVDQAKGAKGAGRYLVRVVADKCIGAASCVAVAPKAFKLNDQQIAEVIESVGTETDENLLLSAQSCPTMAIEVVDTTTGEVVWPK